MKLLPVTIYLSTALAGGSLTMAADSNLKPLTRAQMNEVINHELRSKDWALFVKKHPELKDFGSFKLNPQGVAKHIEGPRFKQFIESGRVGYANSAMQEVSPKPISRSYLKEFEGEGPQKVYWTPEGRFMHSEKYAKYVGKLETMTPDQLDNETNSLAMATIQNCQGTFLAFGLQRLAGVLDLNLAKQAASLVNQERARKSILGYTDKVALDLYMMQDDLCRKLYVKALTVDVIADAKINKVRLSRQNFEEKVDKAFDGLPHN